MKRVRLANVIAIFCLLFSTTAYNVSAKTDAPAVPQLQMLHGKYWGFNRETYAMDQEGLEKYGCPFSISKDDFYANIKNSPFVIAKFRKDNIRAKVLVEGNVSYYIDMSGVLEFNGHLIQIDRKKFEKDIVKRGFKQC